MVYDIYGRHLRPGYCEVHPDVHQQYPCSVCLMEAERDHWIEKEQRAYEQEIYEQYCRDMEAERICELFTTA